MRRSFAVLSVSALALAACGPPTVGVTAPATSAVRWPARVVTADGTRLHAIGTRGPVRCGYVAGGLVVELGAALANALVEVRVPGPLELYGAIPAEALGVTVCRPHELPGVPVFVGLGDLLRLRSGVEQGQVRVRAVVTPSPYVDDQQTLRALSGVAHFDIGHAGRHDTNEIEQRPGQRPEESTRNAIGPRQLRILIEWHA